MVPVRKMRLSLAAGFFLLNFCNLSMGNLEHSPRMKFTEKGMAVKRFNLRNKPPVQILPKGQPDTVLAVGQTNLNIYNFQSDKEKDINMRWAECNRGNSEQDCRYNIILVQPREDANQLFVCGTNERETLCCNTNLAEQSPSCIPSEDTEHLIAEISRFTIKEDESSVLVESEKSTDLYITQSGSQEYVGIHKFGKGRVRPSSHNKEQHYVGLVLSRRRDQPSQNRVYGFYRERNKEPGLYSDMWLPFVTQVCTTDVGGPKNNLQYTWTSQMSARLFCGDAERTQHFSELVDVAAVHAERWQDTKIYALFRNEWGMSAVCVYTIEDINNIFTDSTFKNYTREQMNIPRMCAPDSAKIPMDMLKKISKTSEMEQSVQPAGSSGFLLFNHHKYTHIQVDSSPNTRSSTKTVVFLSLNNGGIHKAVHNESHTYIIAEYQPFEHKEHKHIRSFLLHPASKKLYVASESELVQLDVANCGQYGNTCQECILSRDPDCVWNSTHCTPLRKGLQHDVVVENLSICKKPTTEALKQVRGDPRPNINVVRLHSKHFLRCPVSSHHAQHSWLHLKNTTSCSSREDCCLYLIDSMDAEHEGTYECISEEMGYRKVLVMYQLQLENKAVGRQSKPMIWVGLMVVLITSLSC